MPAGLHAVRVIAPSAMIELLVPETATPADLVPQLLDVVRGVAEDTTADPARTWAARTSLAASPTEAWGLLGPAGRALAPDVPLSGIGIRDGDELYLVVPDRPSGGPQVQPLAPPSAELAARAWSVNDVRSLLAAGAALGLLACTVLLRFAALSDATAFVIRAALAGGWSALAVASARRPRRIRRTARPPRAERPPRAARTQRGGRTPRTPLEVGLLVPTMLAAAAIPMWLTAGALAPVTWASDALAGRVATTALACVVAAGVVAAASWHRAPAAVLTGVVAAALPIGIVGAIAARAGADRVTTAAVLGVLGVVVLRSSAHLAVRIGAMLPDHRYNEHRSVADAMAAVQIGLGTCVAAACAVLAVGGHGVVELAILGCVVVIALVEPRTMRFRLHRWCASLVAVAGAAALVLRVLRPLDTTTAAVLLAVLALVLAALAVGWRAVRWPLSFGHLAALAPAITIAACVPLLVAQLGGFDAVVTLARHWAH